MAERIECPECAFPYEAGRRETCLKCGTPLRGHTWQGLMEVDIAHRGQTVEQARDQLMAAVDRAVAGGHKGLKVIHGMGLSPRGDETIRSMATLLLRSLSARTGGKVTGDKGNPGASILWLN
jgi:hypothetical protein